MMPLCEPCLKNKHLKCSQYNCHFSLAEHIGTSSESDNSQENYKRSLSITEEAAAFEDQGLKFYLDNSIDGESNYKPICDYSYSLPIVDQQETESFSDNDTKNNVSKEKTVCVPTKLLDDTPTRYNHEFHSIVELVMDKYPLDNSNLISNKTSEVIVSSEKVVDGEVPVKSNNKILDSKIFSKQISKTDFPETVSEVNTDKFPEPTPEMCTIVCNKTEANAEFKGVDWIGTDDLEFKSKFPEISHLILGERIKSLIPTIGLLYQELQDVKHVCDNCDLGVTSKAASEESSLTRVKPLELVQNYPPIFDLTSSTEIKDANQVLCNILDSYKPVCDYSYILPDNQELEDVNESRKNYNPVCDYSYILPKIDQISQDTNFESTFSKPELAKLYDDEDPDYNYCLGQTSKNQNAELFLDKTDSSRLVSSISYGGSQNVKSLHNDNVLTSQLPEQTNVGFEFKSANYKPDCNYPYPLQKGEPFFKCNIKKTELLKSNFESPAPGKIAGLIRTFEPTSDIKAKVSDHLENEELSNEENKAVCDYSDLTGSAYQLGNDETIPDDDNTFESSGPQVNSNCTENIKQLIEPVKFLALSEPISEKKVSKHYLSEGKLSMVRDEPESEVSQLSNEVNLDSSCKSTLKTYENNMTTFLKPNNKVESNTFSDYKDSSQNSNNKNVSELLSENVKNLIIPNPVSGFLKNEVKFQYLDADVALSSGGKVIVTTSKDPKKEDRHVFKISKTELLASESEMPCELSKVSARKNNMKFIKKLPWNNETKLQLLKPDDICTSVKVTYSGELTDKEDNYQPVCDYSYSLPTSEDQNEPLEASKVEKLEYISTKPSIEGSDASKNILQTNEKAEIIPIHEPTSEKHFSSFKKREDENKFSSCDKSRLCKLLDFEPSKLSNEIPKKIAGLIRTFEPILQKSNTNEEADNQLPKSNISNLPTKISLNSEIEEFYDKVKYHPVCDYSYLLPTYESQAEKYVENVGYDNSTFKLSNSEVFFEIPSETESSSNTISPEIILEGSISKEITKTTLIEVTNKIHDEDVELSSPKGSVPIICNNSKTVTTFKDQLGDELCSKLKFKKLELDIEVPVTSETVESHPSKKVAFASLSDLLSEEPLIGATERFSKDQVMLEIFGDKHNSEPLCAYPCTLSTSNEHDKHKEVNEETSSNSNAHSVEKVKPTLVTNIELTEPELVYKVAESEEPHIIGATERFSKDQVMLEIFGDKHNSEPLCAYPCTISTSNEHKEVNEETSSNSNAHSVEKVKPTLVTNIELTEPELVYKVAESEEPHIIGATERFSKDQVMLEIFGDKHNSEPLCAYPCTISTSNEHKEVNEETSSNSNAHSVEKVKPTLVTNIELAEPELVYKVAELSGCVNPDIIPMSLLISEELKKELASVDKSEKTILNPVNERSENALIEKQPHSSPVFSVISENFDEYDNWTSNKSQTLKSVDPFELYEGLLVVEAPRKIVDLEYHSIPKSKRSTSEFINTPPELYDRAESYIYQQIIDEPVIINKTETPVAESRVNLELFMGDNIPIQHLGNKTRNLQPEPKTMIVTFKETPSLFDEQTNNQAAAPSVDKPLSTHSQSNIKKYEGNLSTDGKDMRSFVSALFAPATVPAPSPGVSPEEIKSKMDTPNLDVKENSLPDENPVGSRPSPVPQPNPINPSVCVLFDHKSPMTESTKRIGGVEDNEKEFDNLVSDVPLQPSSVSFDKHPINPESNPLPQLHLQQFKGDSTADSSALLDLKNSTFPGQTITKTHIVNSQDVQLQSSTVSSEKHPNNPESIPINPESAADDKKNLYVGDIIDLKTSITSKEGVLEEVTRTEIVDKQSAENQFIDSQNVILETEAVKKLDDSSAGVAATAAITTTGIVAVTVSEAAAPTLKKKRETSPSAKLSSAPKKLSPRVGSATKQKPLASTLASPKPPAPKTGSAKPATLSPAVRKTSPKASVPKLTPTPRTQPLSKPPSTTKAAVKLTNGETKTSARPTTARKIVSESVPKATTKLVGSGTVSSKVNQSKPTTTKAPLTAKTSVPPRPAAPASARPAPIARKPATLTKMSSADKPTPPAISKLPATKPLTKPATTIPPRPRPATANASAPPKPRPAPSRVIAKNPPDTEKQIKESANKITASRNVTQRKGPAPTKLSTTTTTTTTIRKIDSKVGSARTTVTKSTTATTKPAPIKKKPTEVVKTTASKTKTTKIEKPKENGISTIVTQEITVVNNVHTVDQQSQLINFDSQEPGLINIDNPENGISSIIDSQQKESELVKDNSPLDNKIIETQQLVHTNAD